MQRGSMLGRIGQIKVSLERGWRMEDAPYCWLNTRSGGKTTSERNGMATGPLYVPRSTASEMWMPQQIDAAISGP